MANRDLPMGFLPIGHMTGGAIPEPHEYVMTASQKIYKGDPVVITSGGTVSVAAASATTTHIGIAAEYKYDSGASGTMKIKVYDDPDVLYMVQTTNSLTTSIDNVFNTSDIITYAAGSDVTYTSIMELNTPGTSTKPWIILRLWDAPDNAWGEFSKVVVKYNQHTFIAAYAGL